LPQWGLTWLIQRQPFFVQCAALNVSASNPHCGNTRTVVSHFMTTFKVRKQIVTNETYQGYNLTEFSIENNKEENTNRIIDSFIRSAFFTGEQNSEDYIHGHLSQVFKINKVDIDNFRKLDKADTVKFLVDFLNNPSWEDDRIEFATLLDKYFFMTIRN